MAQTSRMPALFLGHGNPMNALADNDFSRALARLAAEVRQLREQLLIVQPSLTRSPDDEEPPPHW